MAYNDDVKTFTSTSGIAGGAAGTIPDPKPSSGGGPAFGEFKQAGQCSIKTGGISVRDYFAAKAMQGMMANPHQMASDESMFARDAYTLADAMLAARSEGDSK